MIEIIEKYHDYRVKRCPENCPRDSADESALPRIHQKDMRLLLAGTILSGYYAGRRNGEEKEALAQADALMLEAEYV